jgi:hypothetical protein
MKGVQHRCLSTTLDLDHLDDRGRDAVLATRACKFALVASTVVSGVPAAAVPPAVDADEDLTQSRLPRRPGGLEAGIRGSPAHFHLRSHRSYRMRHGGARIESARISGTIDGPEAKAVFQARRVLKMGSDGSETQVGLS